MSHYLYFIPSSQLRSALAPIAISSRHPSPYKRSSVNLALRTRDVEAFEDTSLEYVRAKLQVSEIATLRQAPTDVVKALGGVGPNNESAMTGVALEWIVQALAEASAGRSGEDV